MLKFFRVALQVCYLYLFALLGNILVKWLHLPISGSIIGLFIVLALLHFKVLKLSAVELGAGFLMSEMLLFFIPSAVAIIQYKDEIIQHGSQFLIVILLSTITVMIVTGLVAQFSIRRLANKKGEIGK
ncbi:CidA/LrgA family holin-like protein [Sporolactobacillus shoreicorticis]|uniref:CidA/LrgA family protein n=1 Tax=Sporolactobacillus shoreicorticis TaxID=1923877 RepID=A0ABW5S9C2_9BACL|nr:CidA/LrgA family holin-like protein [Sporolactobacillus shoreicorticis]MCO7126649.1 CidA/LrgA family holin-like protein [Sporolactobacillus shoreicorticis]